MKPFNEQKDNEEPTSLDLKYLLKKHEVTKVGNFMEHLSEANKGKRLYGTLSTALATDLAKASLYAYRQSLDREQYPLGLAVHNSLERFHKEAVARRLELVGEQGSPKNGPTVNRDEQFTISKFVSAYFEYLRERYEPPTARYIVIDCKTGSFIEGTGSWVPMQHHLKTFIETDNIMAAIFTSMTKDNEGVNVLLCQRIGKRYRVVTVKELNSAMELVSGGKFNRLQVWVGALGRVLTPDPMHMRRFKVVTKRVVVLMSLSTVTLLALNGLIKLTLVIYSSL